MKQPILEIIWRDAFGGSNWKSIGDIPTEYIIHTIGYLLWENKHYIGTACNLVPERDVVSDTNAIPKKTIISMRYLRGQPKK